MSRLCTKVGVLAGSLRRPVRQAAAWLIFFPSLHQHRVVAWGKFMGLRLTQDCIVFSVADFAKAGSVFSLRASTFLKMFEENLCF